MPVPTVQTRPIATKIRPFSSRAQIHRSHRVNSVQIRTLWWWGRQTCNPNEDFDERLQRHHKIMRSRLYKFVRRRALWDSEDTYMRPGRLSRVLGARYCDYKPASPTSVSNQEAKRAMRSTEPENNRHTFYNDFDEFRAAVDRAIARDPYGTLFGRRLQSPPTSNNSSWTSFSWFTDPKEVKEDEISPESQAKSADDTKSSVEKTSTERSIRVGKQAAEETTTCYSEEEYGYDPILMRKVPIIKQPAGTQVNALPAAPRSEGTSPTPGPQKDPPQPEPQKPLSESRTRKPFLQSLFEEHGVVIPVKTYKPPRVYGYGTMDNKPTKKDIEAELANEKNFFDSSTKQQCRDLMARVKGNSIDTTALFTEASSLQQPHTAATERPAPKKMRYSPEPDDSLPLFSGTTYDAKAVKEVGTNASDWLAKEGFREPAKGSHGAKNSLAEIPVKKFKVKLEPAIDRDKTRPVAESEDRLARLQPALDRQLSAAKCISTSPEYVPEPEKTTLSDEAERLRKLKRAQLEADFETRQMDSTNEADFSPKAPKIEKQALKLSRTFDNVWEHIREHPDGIVAKTMKSMSNLNQNYKKYIRPDAVKGLTDKLLFKDESLSKTPSIYQQAAKSEKVEPFTPSHDVVSAEKERQQRTASLREASEKAKREKETQDARISKLATEIQAIYEAEHGPLESDNRQPVTPPVISTLSADSPLSLSASTQTSTPKHQALLTATVKPGIVTNPVVDNHVNNFEPKFAELVDNAKQIHWQIRRIRAETQELQASLSSPKTESEAEDVKPQPSDVIQGTKEVSRILHEAKATIRGIETRRPAIAWTAPQLSGSDYGREAHGCQGTAKSRDPVLGYRVCEGYER